jgi:hypothetical protein
MEIYPLGILPTTYKTMPNGILKLLLKIYYSRDVLSNQEMSFLDYYSRSLNTQELNYYSKIIDAFHAK